MKQLLFIFILLSVSSRIAAAYNNAIAIALPVQDITVDGDLSDWPEYLPTYPIRINTNAYGPTDLTATNLDSSYDFSPQFRVGYNQQDQLIYIALKTVDDTAFGTPDEYSSAGDGCEVYVHPFPDSSPPLQAIYHFGEDRAAKFTFTHLLLEQLLGEWALNIISDDTIHTFSDYSENVITYEWSLDWEAVGSSTVELRPGLRIGFDVVALDSDGENETQAWVSWSPGTQKNQNSERLGQLVLAEDLYPSKISGIVYNYEGTPLENCKVRVTRADGEWVDLVSTGLGGEYIAWTLPGTFYLTVDGTVETDTIVVKTESGKVYRRDISANNLLMNVISPSDREDEVEFRRGRYMLGDDPVWSQENFTDQSWPIQSDDNFHLPIIQFRQLASINPASEHEATEENSRTLPLQSGVNNGNHVIWFRHRISVSSAWLGESLALSNGTPADTVDYFLNGQKLPTLPADFDRTAVVLFNKEYPNLLATRLAFNEESLSSLFLHEIPPFGDFSLQLMATHLEFKQDGFLTGARSETFFIAVPLILSLIHITLFAFYPRGLENLFFSIFTAGLSGLFIFKTWLDGSEVTSRLLVCIVLLMVWAFLRFLYFLFDNKTNSTLWLFNGAAIALSSGIISYAIYRQYFPQVDNYLFFFTISAFTVFLTGGLLWLLGRLYVPLPRVMWLSWGFFILLTFGQFYIAVAVLGFGIIGEVMRILLDALRKKLFGSLTVSLGVFGALLSYPFAAVISFATPNLLSPQFIVSIGWFSLLSAISIHLGRSIAHNNRNLEKQVIQIQDLSEENLKQERTLRSRMEQELEEARQLQLSMLPNQLPQHPQIDVAWYMKTATEVGGDYYDYDISNDTLTFTLGDATGHGINAGTLVSATKGLFVNLADKPSITDILRSMSSTLKAMKLHRIYMAMNMVKYKDYTLRVSSAGMPPILLFRSAEKTVQEILIEGIPLGFLARAKYEEQTFTVTPGDTLLLMSDGLPERCNPDEEEYGYDRVQTAFSEVADQEPAAIIERLKQKGDDWAQGKPQDDDITLAVLKVKE